MKKNLRGKIREYIQSEEGKVSVKSPLALGVAAGGLLLAHAIVGTPRAEAGWCYNTGVWGNYALAIIPVRVLGFGLKGHVDRYMYTRLTLSREAAV